MPATTRTWARRELELSTKNLLWAQTHILRVAEVYTDQHPEIAAPLVLATDTLGELITLLEKTRRSF